MRDRDDRTTSSSCLEGTAGAHALASTRILSPMRLTSCAHKLCQGPARTNCTKVGRQPLFGILSRQSRLEAATLQAPGVSGRPALPPPSSTAEGQSGPRWNARTLQPQSAHSSPSCPRGCPTAGPVAQSPRSQPPVPSSDIMRAPGIAQTPRRVDHQHQVGQNTGVERLFTVPTGSRHDRKGQ